MKMREISSKSIERLSIYRRALLTNREVLGPSVFSHQLASTCRLSAVQVRRDLMAIGYSGSPNTGYDVKRLLSSIGSLLDPAQPKDVAIVGMGYLGRAIAAYLVDRLPRIRLAAGFDVDLDKIGLTFSGVYCHSIRQMPEVIANQKIELGILTVPGAVAQEAAEQLVAAGVIGILNFAPVCLHLHERIFVENIDMTVALGKVAFFARGPEREKGRNR